ncbi:hypothetical protein DH2020_004000 [Rehmannia glutinosa]|uniref:BHLH domain-containing protein n=1 Tax=Rehmannia glutinosa TaxID=99300 RepID=A0ABR0XN89_REHGL
MEFFGAFVDEEWESLSKMFDNNPENSFFPNCDDIIIDTNYFCCVSQESSNSSEIERALFINQGNENGVNFDVINDYNTIESMNFNIMDCNNDNGWVIPDNVMEEILNLKAEMCNDNCAPPETDDPCKEMQLKRKSEDYSPESPKKKPRGSRNAKKNQKAVESKKKKKVNIQDNDINNEEEIINIQSLSSCSSEDDCNSSQEQNGGSTSESKDSPCLNSNGKARATRGSATDPQSLYARKRREKINERLRILQNLVPNGTKVYISTMLEEAVHYVKFLQLQIKLLSSDDLWMYAPIAYNGMDIGMYQKISPNMWPIN